MRIFQKRLSHMGGTAVFCEGEINWPAIVWEDTILPYNGGAKICTIIYYENPGFVVFVLPRCVGKTVPFSMCYHLAPSRFRTLRTVSSRMRKSMPADQLLMYCMSSRMTSSKSVMSLRPEICHMPVMPGRKVILAR